MEICTNRQFRLLSPFIRNCRWGATASSTITAQSSPAGPPSLTTVTHMALATRSWTLTAWGFSGESHLRSNNRVGPPRGRRNSHSYDPTRAFDHSHIRTTAEAPQRPSVGEADHHLVGHAAFDRS